MGTVMTIIKYFYTKYISGIEKIVLIVNLENNVEVKNFDIIKRHTSF